MSSPIKVDRITHVLKIKHVLKCFDGLEPKLSAPCFVVCCVTPASPCPGLGLQGTHSQICSFQYLATLCPEIAVYVHSHSKFIHSLEV